MSVYGANIEQLAELRMTFSAEAVATRELCTRIRGRVDGTTWTGPAAERFRDAWASQFEPALRNLEQALTDASSEVAQRREALVQVSQ